MKWPLDITILRKDSIIDSLLTKNYRVYAPNCVDMRRQPGLNLTPVAVQNVAPAVSYPQNNSFDRWNAA